MKIFDTHHHSRMHSLVRSNLWNFELSVWLYMIGWSVISIFIPILMLTHGYSLTAVLLYEAIYYLLDTPLNFTAAQLTAKYGARAMMIIATASAIVYFSLFHYLSLGGFGIL